MDGETENEEKPIWLNLLDPLTELILERLPLTDYIHFGAVCRQWRSIQRNHRLRHAPGPPPMPRPLPWLIPTNVDRHLDCYSPLDHTFHRFPLPGGVSHCLTSCRGWLLMYYDSWPQQRANHLVLFNPVSGTKILLLAPGLSCYINLCAMSAPPTDPNCTILLIFNCKILLHQLTGGCSDWTMVASLPDNSATALVYGEGKFYILASERMLYVVDHLLPVPALHGLKMDCSLLTMSICCFILVESDGDLLLVEGISEWDLAFLVEEYRVFRADFSRKKWVQVETLGDRVLFLDSGCSLSLLASDVGCKKNCICCTWSFVDDLAAWRVFDLDTRRWIEGTAEPLTEVEGPCAFSGHWFLPTLDCPW